MAAHGCAGAAERAAPLTLRADQLLAKDEDDSN
jgi:hypothetical protein